MSVLLKINVWNHNNIGASLLNIKHRIKQEYLVQVK